MTKLSKQESKELSEQDLSHIEKVIVDGNLATLAPEEKITFYKQMCESLKLNPLSKPFDYIQFPGSNKLALYANKECAAQLRANNKISITDIQASINQGIYTVIAKGRKSNGVEDVEIGSVSIEGLKGQALGNAMMKAMTKAKRRLTLSISGLGFLDETEVEAISGAKRFSHDEVMNMPIMENIPNNKFENLQKLKDGEIIALNEKVTIPRDYASKESVKELKELVEELGEHTSLVKWLERASIYAPEDFTQYQADGCLKILRSKKIDKGE